MRFIPLVRTLGTGLHGLQTHEFPLVYFDFLYLYMLAEPSPLLTWDLLYQVYPRRVLEGANEPIRPL